MKTETEIDPELAQSPEFLEAERARVALEAKTKQIADAKAARAAIVAEHSAMTAALEELRARRIRGAAEVDGLDALAQVKFDEAAHALGSFVVRPGLAMDRVRVGLELSGIVKHLRRVLEEMDTKISTAEKALEKFAKANGAP